MTVPSRMSAASHWDYQKLSGERLLEQREMLDTRGRLGTAPALAIASQLAQSLAAAHEQGVIHRDIKPQNRLLDASRPIPRSR